MREKTGLIVAVTFWIVVMLLGIRRRGQFGRSDLLFVALGYPVMLIPCLIVRGEF